MRTFEDSLESYEESFGKCDDKSTAEWFYTQGKLHAVQDRHEALTKEIENEK